MARTDLDAFLAEETAFDRAVVTASRRAEWEFMTTGTEEAQERSRRAVMAVREHFADAERYARVDAWRNQGVATEPLRARQVELLWRDYLDGQEDRATLEALTRLETEQQGLFNRFRATLDGRSWSENDLNEALATETDAAKVRRVWEAAKQIGEQAAERAMQIVRLRNQAARHQGFADAFEKGLVLGELTEARLFGLLDALEQATDAPYRRAKAALDQQLAQRFGIGSRDLRPWHYGDPFFQRPPRAAQPPLDAFFADKQLDGLAAATIDTIGLDARPILARSDMYPRPGKNQHAFCSFIEADGSDVRVLCNLNQTYHWMSVLLHELGHALHWEYADRSLPPKLVHPPHGLVAETESQLLERVAIAAPWLHEIVGVPAQEAEARAAELEEHDRLAALIMARWSLVMAHFERAMFQTPDADLDSLWWDLVERFQLISRPEGRKAPDWAAKIHLANFPGSYYVYILGELAVAQMRAALRRDIGGFYGHPEAGEYLRTHLYQLGSRDDWETTIEKATGERLGTGAFVQELVATTAAGSGGV